MIFSKNPFQTNSVIELSLKVMTKPIALLLQNNIKYAQQQNSLDEKQKAKMGLNSSSDYFDISILTSTAEKF